MPKLVALCLAGGPAFVKALQRVWDTGDAVLPVDLRLPPPTIANLLDTMGVAEVVDNTGERQSRGGHTRLPPLEPGDAVVVATSGTTGQPKGVVLTHHGIAASAHLTSARLNVTDEDHWLACLPLAHIGGLSVVMRALLTHTALTVLPRFDAAQVQRQARTSTPTGNRTSARTSARTSKGATLVSLVPTALQRIDPGLFRLILLGGTALPTDLPDNVVTTYGMTETASGVVYNGMPLDGVELRIGPDEQIQVRSPTLLRCYRDGTDPRDGQGWFCTGDAGLVDSSGKLRVFGRMAHVINTGGEKVWPVAVEAVLRKHPAVSEALVTGEADPQWGQRVVATVELVEPANGQAPTLHELRELAKQHLAAYAVPKELRVVKRLPRTPNGKVIRPPAP